MAAKYLLMQLHKLDSLNAELPTGELVPLKLDLKGLAGLMLVFDTKEDAKEFSPDSAVIEMEM